MQFHPSQYQYRQNISSQPYATSPSALSFQALHLVHDGWWDRRKVCRLMIFLSDYVAVFLVSEGREEAEECGHDGESVREVRVVDLRVGQPEPVVLEGKSKHDHRTRLHHSCDDRDVGHCLHDVERRPSPPEARLVVPRSVIPNSYVKDQCNDFNDQRYRDEYLNDYEPRRHDPIPDIVQFRRQNPPASMIRLLSRISVQDLSGKARLPKTDLTESRVDPGPGDDPVGGTE